MQTIFKNNKKCMHDFFNIDVKQNKTKQFKDKKKVVRIANLSK